MATDARCKKLLPEISVPPAKLRSFHDNNHPVYEIKYISFIDRKTAALANCHSIMVRSSKTDIQIAKTLQSTVNVLDCMRKACNCRNGN